MSKHPSPPNPLPHRNQDKSSLKRQVKAVLALLFTSASTQNSHAMLGENRKGCPAGTGLNVIDF